MSTKFGTLKTLLTAVVFSALALSGCGGGSSTGNVVTVSVTPKGTITAPLSVIVTQAITFTGTVTGATDTSVTWGCTYATSTFDSTGKQTTGTATACSADSGTIPANSTNSTVIFTAPQKIPDPKTIAGNNCGNTQLTCILEITITATSVADTKKTDTSVLIVDSGISVTLTPPTATVPTSSDFKFSATLTNDLQSQGVTWLISQGTIDLSKGINYPQLTTCDPTCGHIDTATGLYTAPATVPTTATVTLVASSKADVTRFAIGTITIVTAGAIQFNGISPIVMPQGAATYDLYIFAPGITSASQVILTPTQGSAKSYNFNNPQLKILFPIPTTTVTTPTSTGVRIRLNATDLASSDTYTVSVVDTNHPPTLGPGPFKFSVVPVRGTAVASQPDSYVQNSQSLGLSVLVNGGYFGPPSTSTTPALVQTTFVGSTVSAAASSSSRRLNLNFPVSNANSAPPGLYQLSVARTFAPLPAENNPSVTNMSLFPNYQNVSPAPGASISMGATALPSAIDIDQQTGIAAVASTGLNRVDFFQIGGGGGAGTIASIGFTAAVNVPTSVSINHTKHQVSVVSFKDQSVAVFQMPTSVNGTITSPLQPIATISLAGLVPPRNDTPTTKYLPPFAYSIGVDSDTNHAVVAYSSSSNPTTALVGFLLDLNPGVSDCIATAQQTPATVSPCVSGQVSLATGLYPQVAMLPHTHSAVVTPGGLGSTASIDVLHNSSSVGIKNVSLTSGLVTVVTTADHGINPITPGTVLISNVSPGITNQINFNGPFVVQSVINSTTFTYALAQTVNDTATGGTVFFGNPNLSAGGLAQTTQGVAVNPITGVVAAADANATGSNGPQINLLSSLDQSFSSILFRTTFDTNQNMTVGCTVYTSITSTCAGGPELLGTTSVAFQPFANLLVSYNGPQNQFSVSDPVTQQRYAWIQLTPGPNPVQTVTVPQAATGFSADIALNGGLAVDAATNQAVVVNSKTGTVTLVGLGPAPPTVIKSVHVTEVIVPSASPNDPFTQGGISGANFPQGTQTSTTDLAGVKIFGSGFSGTGTTVRLDGIAIPGATIRSDREIDLTIPASFLAAPHRYALDVVSSGATSNASDFFVVKIVDLSQVCKDTNGNPITKPASVAIADQLGLGSYAPKAIVSNSGCNNVAVIDIAPQLPTFLPSGQFDKFVDNPPNGTNTAGFGTFATIQTGSSPSGVAVSPRFGLAVVANNGAGTASILDIINKKQAVPDVTTGSGPIGVAINEGTGAALVANTQQNTLSEINLGLLFPPPGSTTAAPTTLTAISIGVDTAPIAVAIDPDRGTNNNGLAVVTALALTSSFPRGVLDAVDIGSTSPAKSTTAAVGAVTLTPTGVVFDPSVSPTLFYAVSSGGNLVSSFNPDTGASSSVRVGINPTSLALNPQTGGIMTVNTLNSTVSIVDTLSSPFKTRRSYGLPGPPPVGTTINQLQTNQVAIDQFLNMAVIVDQAHHRVLLFPMPN